MYGIARVFRFSVAGMIAAAIVWTGAGTLAAQAPVTMVDGQSQPEWMKVRSMFRPASEAPNNLLIDQPVKGTIYPPDIIAPQFLWRDNNAAATVWRIEIAFASGKTLRAWSNGEKLQVGRLVIITWLFGSLM